MKQFGLASKSLVALVAFAAPACKGNPDKAAPSAQMVTEPASSSTAVVGPPRGTLAFLAPPLGAPDTIAPPTLDLVPGMLVADASAKGAKAQSNGNDWTWRPNADLKVDKDHGIIEQIVGIYTPAEIEALKQEWGKPTFGEDYWMGASWLAGIGSNCGSEPPCFVYFMRAPNEKFFGKSPVPPLGLGKLAFGTAAADIKKMFGFEPDGFTETGYGYKVTWDLSSDESFESVTLSSSTFIEKEQEIAYLTSLWGKPTKHDDDALMWLDLAARWAAIHDVGQIEYFPLVLWSDLLAKDGEHSILATSAKLLGAKQAAAGPETRDWPGTEADPTETTRVELGFDDEVVTSVQFRIGATEASLARYRALIEKELGKPALVKNEYDDEIQVITTGGLAIQLDQQDWGFELTARKSK